VSNDSVGLSIVLKKSMTLCLLESGSFNFASLEGVTPSSHFSSQSQLMESSHGIEGGR